MDVYLVVVHDVVVQSREYAVIVPKGSSPDIAKEKVLKGEFLIESESTTTDNLQESQIVSAEKVGWTE